MKKRYINKTGKIGNLGKIPCKIVKNKKIVKYVKKDLFHPLFHILENKHTP